jgi:hypothetical protein
MMPRNIPGRERQGVTSSGHKSRRVGRNVLLQQWLLGSEICHGNPRVWRMCCAARARVIDHAPGCIPYGCLCNSATRTLAHLTSRHEAADAGAAPELEDVRAPAGTLPPRQLGRPVDGLHEEAGQHCCCLPHNAAPKACGRVQVDT